MYRVNAENYLVPWSFCNKPSCSIRFHRKTAGSVRSFVADLPRLRRTRSYLLNYHYFRVVIYKPNRIGDLFCGWGFFFFFLCVCVCVCVCVWGLKDVYVVLFHLLWIFANHLGLECLISNFIKLMSGENWA